MKKFERREFKPWGDDGPTFRLIPQQQLPKEGSELSFHGLEILRHMPTEDGTTSNTRRLAEELRSLGDYAGFDNMVEGLVKGGYLIKDENNWLSLTDKGRNELPKKPSQ